MKLQCPLNRITLGRHESYSNNRMIQLIDVFCELYRDIGTSNLWLQKPANSIIRDSFKRRALNLITETHCRKILNSKSKGEKKKRNRKELYFQVQHSLQCKTRETPEDWTILVCGHHHRLNPFRS
jgi:hypothetical protein